MLICICGNSCSGKSSLAKYIESIIDNSLHIDIDSIAHKIINYEEVKEELNKEFNNIIENNQVNRKILGEIVFNSKEEMSKLEMITWKYMEDEIDKIINDNKDKTIILDYLLLPKTKYYQECDIRILLDIPYEERKERAMKRDSLTSSEFDLREKGRFDYNKEDFDYIIKSSDDINNLVNQLKK